MQTYRYNQSRGDPLLKPSLSDACRGYDHFSDATMAIRMAVWVANAMAALGQRVRIRSPPHADLPGEWEAFNRYRRTSAWHCAFRSDRWMA